MALLNCNISVRLNISTFFSVDNSAYQKRKKLLFNDIYKKKLESFECSKMGKDYITMVS